MPLTKEIRHQIWKRDKGICQQCKVALTEEYDFYDSLFENIMEMTEIPIYKWKYECYNCAKETDIVSYHLELDDHLIIGDIEGLDRELMKIYPFVKEGYNFTQNEKTINNTCIHCGIKQGRHFIEEQMFEQFGEHGEKNLIDRYIPNIIDFDKPPLCAEDYHFVDEKKLTRFANIHHKDRNRENNIPENLILLCRNCHIKTHTELRKERGNQQKYDKKK